MSIVLHQTWDKENNGLDRVGYFQTIHALVKQNWLGSLPVTIAFAVKIPKILNVVEWIELLLSK